MSEKQSD